MDSSFSKTDSQLSQPSKRSYSTPTLADYGTVAQVTQAGVVTPVADGTTLSS